MAGWVARPKEFLKIFMEFVSIGIIRNSPRFLRQLADSAGKPFTRMPYTYFKFTFRRLWKDRRFTILNLVGLSTGLAAAILIYLWAYDELQVDHFFKNDRQLYQVMSNHQDGDKVITNDNGSAILGETLQKELPEVEAGVSTTPASWFRKINIANGNTAVKATGNFAGQEYFTVFPYELVEGNRQQLLTNKNAIVISEQLAKKMFNTTSNVTGKVLEWKWLKSGQKCVVTGVYKNTSANATLQFDCILSLDSWGKDVMHFTGTPDISGGPFNNFIVLKKGTNVAQFNKKIAGFIKQQFPESTISLFVRPYADGYLYGNYENGMQAGGRIEYVKLFFIIGIFILLIACINFMNLSTAKAAQRMKEVGVKKTLGASRWSLVYTFMGESLMLSGMALLIALLLVWVLLPQFNAFTQKQLNLPVNAPVIASVIGIALLAGLVAGSYPALYLSRFRPAITLKGKFTGSVNELWVRKGLVVFQFSLSVFFMIGVIVVNNQVRYIQSKDPGFDKDNVIVFEMEGNSYEKKDAFFAAVKMVPGVVQASRIMNTIVLPAWAPGGGVRWDNKNEDDAVRFNGMPIGYDMIETLGIHIVAGRSFSRDFATDSTAVIVNEEAVKQMHLQEPIGKVITVSGEQKHIVGVARDFHFNSLHEPIHPFILHLATDETLLAMVKINREHRQATINALSAFYKKFNPGYPFEYKFLDDEYQAQYASEKLVANLSKYFAGLTIIITCLGLFGLAAFRAETRRKEIGIRKVLGATVSNIVGLLSKEFLYLVFAALLVAFPLAWWVMNQWLQSFAYRIDIGASVFVIATTLIIAITICTISFQAVKSALENPVGSLKAEA